MKIFHGWQDLSQLLEFFSETALYKIMWSTMHLFKQPELIFKCLMKLMPLIIVIKLSNIVKMDQISIIKHYFSKCKYMKI